MILFLISSFGACKEIARLTCKPSFPYLKIPGTTPEVDTVMCLAPIDNPN